MRVWLSPEAEADLQATLEFIRERNPTAAIALASRVFDAIEQLAAGGFEGPQQQLKTGESVRFRIYHHARRPIAR